MKIYSNSSPKDIVRNAFYKKKGEGDLFLEKNRVSDYFKTKER